MGESVFALRYGSIELVGRVIPHEVGPSAAFLPLEHPVPVGTAVELVAETGQIQARVIRVVESAKGGARGVWIRLSDDSDAARALWEPLVTADDPASPEPVGAAGPAAPSEIRRPGPAGDTVATPVEAAGADQAETDKVLAPGGSTQVMSAVDVATALARETSANPEPEGPDAGETLPMGSAPAEKEKKTKKKRKRKRR